MSVSSKLFSGSMQSAMSLLTWVDERWGNRVINMTGANPDPTPYTRLPMLRQRGTVLRTYLMNGWFVLGHAHVQSLFRDKRLSAEITNNKLMNMVLRSAARGLYVPALENPHMLNRDAPDHTRLRKLTAKSFTNRFVQSMKPDIEQLVETLLATIPDDAKEVDIVNTLAKPLPAIVIAQMLGVPVEERHLFERWSEDLLGYTKLLEPAAMQAAVEADLAILIYLKELTEDKRQNPGDDLISKMIEAEEDGDKLSVDELYSTCLLLLVAGHETTTRLISSCLYLLLSNPAELEKLQADRSLMAGAIEEALRIEPPVLAVARLVKESFTFDDKKFKQGQLVTLSIAGANRDPAVIPDPETFNISRVDPPHISFGHGIHLCLGMPLARMEAEIALNRLLDKYPDMSLVTADVSWERNPFFRGLEELAIKIH